MKDIFKKYKKQKSISNIGIIAMSLVFAIGINIFIFDDNGYVKNLKTSVIESQIASEKSDIYFENNESNFELISSKNINEVKSISFSMTYNPENINVVEKQGVQIISSGNGISTFLITYDEAKDISKNDRILDLEIVKNQNTTENINIIEANFTDNNNNIYNLSTSGITF